MISKDQIEEIKNLTDLKGFVERDLGQPKFKGRSAWNWQCPFHHEQKGHSLAVWRDRWKCFGKCSNGGDLITWVMEYHSMNFQDACRFLGASEDIQTMKRERTQKRRLSEAPPPPKPKAELPPGEWQQNAYDVTMTAYKALWSDEGKNALQYLYGRGFENWVIHYHYLGYIQGKPGQWVKLHNMNVPAGLLIPHFFEQETWALKVRLAKADKNGNKYLGVRGNRFVHGYLEKHLGLQECQGLPVILLEGEFDALSVWQAAADLISPVGLGGVGNVNSLSLEHLVFAPAIYLALDSDEAGANATRKLGVLSKRIKPVRFPDGYKDANELLIAEGNQGIRRWVGDLVGIKNRT